MKKIVLLVFGLCSFLGYSQKTNDNEIKFNLPYFIAGIPEVSYERIVDSTSSAGIALAIAIDKPENVKKRFILTPYYRLFFGKAKAKGFYIEANAAFIEQKGTTYYNNYYAQNTSINFGFGAAAGIKFLNKNGYVGDIYGGVG